MRMLKTALLCVALALTLFQGVANADPELKRPRTVIKYGADPMQTLNLYPAEGAGSHELIAFVHGGGWTKGGDNLAPDFYGLLTKAGYSVASIGYRLVPETDVAGSAGDVAMGVAYLLAHAPALEIDPAHFIFMGHSAGAHLIALLATDDSYLTRAGVDPQRLSAVVPLDGVYDVTALIEQAPKMVDPRVFGEDRQVWRKYSPVDWLPRAKNHPHFCLIHEDTNREFVEQASIFANALRNQHENFGALTAPGLNHVQLIQEFSRDDQPMSKFFFGCVRAGK